MKNSLLFAGLCALLFSSCSKKEDSTGTGGGSTTPQWVASGSTSDMMLYLNTKAPAFNAYTVNAVTGGIITNDGIGVMVPPDAFVQANGSPVTGNVTLKMQTIRTTKDMIYSGITTTADNGELLVSDGMFKLEVYDASNNKLKLKTGSTLTVAFSAYNSNNLMFTGNEVSGNNKVEWERWDSVGTKRFGDSTLLGGFDKIFQYCNLDRYMTGTLTDLTVKIPSGFTNKNSDCFIKYANENASAYIPSNATLKAFSTVGGHYKVVEGLSAKVICFAKKDGKFYYQVKTIASITSNSTLTMDNMAETTEANLQTVIAGF